MYQPDGSEKATGDDDGRLRNCRQCGESKPCCSDNFPLKGGRLAWKCRQCQRDSDRKKYRASPAKLDSVHSWRARNPEKVRDAASRYYYRNQERAKKAVKEWADRNQEKRRGYAAALHERRQANDPMYRLKRSVRTYLRLCVLSGKVSARTEAMLGYSIADLKSHLERQFTEGMDWSNYGEWHIDHIIPVSSFSFSSHDDEDFKRCWSLPNLRPLWGIDNIIKGNKAVFLL